MQLCRPLHDYSISERKLGYFKFKFLNCFAPVRPGHGKGSIVLHPVLTRQWQGLALGSGRGQSTSGGACLLALSPCMPNILFALPNAPTHHEATIAESNATLGAYRLPTCLPSPHWAFCHSCHSGFPAVLHVPHRCVYSRLQVETGMRRAHHWLITVGWCSGLPLQYCTADSRPYRMTTPAPYYIFVHNVWRSGGTRLGLTCYLLPQAPTFLMRTRDDGTQLRSRLYCGVGCHQQMPMWTLHVIIAYRVHSSHHAFVYLHLPAILYISWLFDKLYTILAITPCPTHGSATLHISSRLYWCTGCTFFTATHYERAPTFLLQIAIHVETLHLPIPCLGRVS